MPLLGRPGACLRFCRSTGVLACLFLNCLSKVSSILHLLSLLVEFSTRAGLGPSPRITASNSCALARPARRCFAKYTSQTTYVQRERKKEMVEIDWSRQKTVGDGPYRVVGH